MNSEPTQPPQDSTKPSSGSARPSKTLVSPRLAKKFLLKRSFDSDSSSVSWAPKTQKRNDDLRLLCAVLSWMETFVWIRTKTGRIVRFRMNRVQKLMAQWLAMRIYEGVPPRCWIPKYRQGGVSTFWQILFFALAELIPGYRVAVAAHDDAGAGAVFSRVVTALRQIRKHKEWPAPEILQEQAGHVLWESESSIQGATIKTGDALLKGTSLNAVHFSETANFADRGINAQAAIGSLLPAVDETDVWSIIVHESTAKGKDAIFWAGCEAARDPNSGSAYGLIFLPWFLEDPYQMTWGEYRKRLVASGKHDPGPTFERTHEEELLCRKLSNVRVRQGQEWYRWRVDLTDEKLIWRRWAIDNKCDGKLDLFQRYYPSFYEEAFTASADCMFTEESIDYYRKHSKPPVERGVLHETLPGLVFFEGNVPDGNVMVWERPNPLNTYVIGADPGGEKIKSDPYNAYVLDKHNLRVVAQVHGLFEWDVFSDTVERLGYWYNTALIVPENNVQPAICKRLHRRAYPRLFYYFEPDTARQKEGRSPGFNTNKKTRPQLEKVLELMVRTKRVVNPDPEFWREMENFVWVPKPHAQNPSVDGSYKATGGNHDDRIMSLALALMMAPRPEPVMHDYPQEDAPSDAYKALLRLQQQDEEAARNRVVHLGARKAS